MQKNKKFLISSKFLAHLLIGGVFLCTSCKSLYNADYKKPDLVDAKASKELKKLHKKLYYISKEGFAVGHQDDTAYGIGWTKSDFPNVEKSDVHDVIGDFPAVYGFDISKIELASDKNIDGIPFNTMRELIIDAYSKGGIITISWHADNPKTNGDSWDATPAVNTIIGEGQYVEKYNLWLERVAVFLKSLKYKGKTIPVAFRPFHEMNGAWFWWGNPNCNAIEYIQLWRNTVRVLRDQHKLHNLFYVYSPNKLNPEDDYLAFYPGDKYVDILGIDIYDFKNSEDYIAAAVHDLNLVQSIAKTKDKLYAFTETGLEAITTANWFSQVVYPNLENTGISWVLFWRNHTKKHHYMPYKGHASEADFKAFENAPKTLFLKDINQLKL
ncbi:glycoside hydrolase family 26 protein [Tamlana sp. I1]|uniref:glycoside hydrolase family 26 protein n=1 Tax=Tamlana sp. I1 TaxID=2762061 RepID=UPI00188F270D|nr:glycosyl hydrolase [Tamlana sp. I1]